MTGSEHKVIFHTRFPSDFSNHQTDGLQPSDAFLLVTKA
jgi:hypothetical protein